MAEGKAAQAALRHTHRDTVCARGLKLGYLARPYGYQTLVTRMVTCWSRRSRRRCPPTTHLAGCHARGLQSTIVDREELGSLVQGRSSSIKAHA